MECATHTKRRKQSFFKLLLNAGWMTAVDLFLAEKGKERGEVRV